MRELVMDRRMRNEKGKGKNKVDGRVCCIDLSFRWVAIDLRLCV